MRRDCRREFVIVKTGWLPNNDDNDESSRLSIRLFDFLFPALLAQPFISEFSIAQSAS